MQVGEGWAIAKFSKKKLKNLSHKSDLPFCAHSKKKQLNWPSLYDCVNKTFLKSGGCFL